MENIFKLYNIKKKDYEDQIIYTTDIIPNKIYKIQLLKEVFPSKSSKSIDAHCTYKNQIILKNRNKNYDPHNHTFIESTKQSNSIIQKIINF